ncbi:MAG: hypothetical protein HYR88_00640 [Verrucomicrobia bacterium]|nr:hypothetical protein [Verrucomicrobiota bacterium]MBI3871014.1 hypothetical protein [Verrucomicrobiota bacterium]
MSTVKGRRREVKICTLSVGPKFKQALAPSDGPLYRSDVRRILPSRPGHPLWRSIVGGCLLALWLLSTLMAASPDLHALLHPDAQSSSHECFITQLHRQDVDCPAVTQFVLPPPQPGLLLTLHESQAALPSNALSEPRDRGPPSTRSSQSERGGKA